METFFIITNDTRDAGRETAYKVKRCMESYGKKCIMDEGTGAGVPEHIDCAVAIGGDGTFIQAARRLFGKEIPLLGINRGTLGYLTEADAQNTEEAVRQLMEGRFFIEKRMMLHGSVSGGKSDVALNDIVVSRTDALHVVSLNLYVNGEFLNSYKADGIIVSTPTGSTAYNLSAGGPIVEPTASLMVITPICSHALNTSSIILSDEDEIVIEIGSRRQEMEEAAVTYDGDDVRILRTGDRVLIRKAEQTTKMIKLSKISFLETMREKMRGN